PEYELRVTFTPVPGSARVRLYLEEKESQDMRFVLAATAALAAAAGSADAALLNLVPGAPDVASGFISIDYNASSGAFLASGSTQNLSIPPNTFPMGQRQFQLTATIDSNGNIVGPGSMTVRGDYGGTNQLLYFSNTILAFGFGQTDKFEF